MRMLFRTRERKLRQTFDLEALPHLDALYGVGLRLTRNERDAEDLVQDTVLRAFRFFHQFEPGTNCKAWLFRIQHNVFVNKYRRRVRERQLAGTLEEAGGVGPTLSQRAVDIARDPERQLAEASLSDDVQRALDALPEDFRLAVILCDLEELSYKEIADVLDCPVGTVMSRLHRGRRQLQLLLAGYAAEHGIGTQAAPRTGAVIPFRREVRDATSGASGEG